MPVFQTIPPKRRVPLSVVSPLLFHQVGTSTMHTRFGGTHRGTVTQCPLAEKAN